MEMFQTPVRLLTEPWLFGSLSYKHLAPDGAWVVFLDFLLQHLADNGAGSRFRVSCYKYLTPYGAFFLALLWDWRFGAQGVQGMFIRSLYCLSAGRKFTRAQLRKVFRHDPLHAPGLAI